MIFSYYYRCRGGEKNATGVAIVVRLDFTDQIDNIERRRKSTKEKRKRNKSSKDEAQHLLRQGEYSSICMRVRVHKVPSLGRNTVPMIDG